MRILNTILIILLLSACATPEKKITLPSQELRGQLGVIQLNTIPPPKRQPIEPNEGKAKGTLEGAGAGVLYSIGGGIQEGSLAGLFVGILLAPVGAVVGAGVGYATAHAGNEVYGAVAIANKVLDQYKYEETLADVCLKKTNQIAGDFDVRPTKQFNSRIIADTILDLKYKEFRWHMLGDTEPDLFLKAAIFATLTNVNDQKVIYSREWVYTSPKTNLFVLSVDNGRLLKIYMQRAIESLCENMANDLFVNKNAKPIQ